MKVFSGSSNRPLAEKVAGEMGLRVSPLEIFVFPDGERRIRLEDSVVGEDVVVAQSTSAPVDQNYMELFFLAEVMKRSGARSVTAVVPYLGYQRQDHLFREGELVSLEIVVKLLEEVGIDRVISFDFHSVEIPKLFSVPVSHLSALPLFAEEIRGRGWLGKDSVLVSPDTGGLRRVKILSKLLGNMPYVVVDKRRDLVTGLVEVAGFKNDAELGSFSRALLVDDMISSGTTMIKSAGLLSQHGISEVVFFVTHPVFSADAPWKLEESVVKEVVVTDTVVVPEEKRFEKLKIVSVSSMIGKELGLRAANV